MKPHAFPVDPDAWVKFCELPHWFGMSERWIRTNLLPRSDFPKPVRVSSNRSVWRAGDLMRFRASVFETRRNPDQVEPVTSQNINLITR